MVSGAPSGPPPIPPGAEADATYRWLRPLAVAAVAVVVTAAFQTHPRPGLTGDHLAVGGALLLFAVGTVALVRGSTSSAPGLFVLFAVVVLAAATLVGLQPDGAGFLGVFPAVSAAALRLSMRAAVNILSLAVGVLAIVWAVAGGRPVLAIVLNEFGVVAFFLLAVFARRYRIANDRAHQLIAELNETRAAQAQAAALAERQRLAREMHDVLAHTLSGLILNLEGARLTAQRQSRDPRLGESIGRALRLAKSGLEEARRAIGMLRGDALPGPERLAELAADFQADTGIPCTFACEGSEPELVADGRLTIYRVAQEALTNIRKHAQPERVRMHLAYRPGGAELLIEDHGRDGDRPPPGDGSGYGLTGMRERAELLGGTLDALATDDGFRVTLWIPA